METCRDGLDFNLACIPAEFTMEAKELFDLAYERGKEGYDWEKMPPELEEAPLQCQ